MVAAIKSKMQPARHRPDKTKKIIKKRRVILALQNPTKNTRRLVLGILFVSIFLVYFLLSLRFTGPVYLADEIGYLTKAAAFAGSPSAAASSYHGGYSLLLSPIFLITSDPFVAWRLVIAANSLMFASCFMILFLVLKKIFSESSFYKLLLLILVTASYPAWLSVVGYAFPTPSFLLFFMALTYVLLRFERERPATLVAIGILSGLLYWIHPMALPVLGSLALLFFYEAVQKRDFKDFAIFVVCSLTVVFMYARAVHPWINEEMAINGYQALDHYGRRAGQIGALFDPSTWLNSLIIMLGRWWYILISTFGIVAYGLIHIGNKTFGKLVRIKMLSREESTLLFLALSLLAIIVFSSLTPGLNPNVASRLRVDHWIYGRYSEMILLPIMGVGLMAVWRKKYILWTTISVLLSGFILALYTNDSNTLNVFNPVTVPAFWPETIMSDLRFGIWFLLGGVGVLAVGLLGKRWVLPIMIVVSVLCVGRQFDWHTNLLSGYSKPSDLVKVISTGKNIGCIGFAPQELETYKEERRSMYSYYFYAYNFQRMSEEQWLDSVCNLYLTYNAEPLGLNREVAVVGREYNENLYLYAKSDKFELGEQGYTEGFYLNRSYPEPNICLFSGCFSRNSEELQVFTNGIGVEDGNTIKTAGQSGYLFYGPYAPLKTGRYDLSIEGDFRNLRGARLEVISNVPEEQIKIVEFDTIHQDDTLVIPFELSVDSDQLEIRLFVGVETDLNFESYSILPSHHTIYLEQNDHITQ